MLTRPLETSIQQITEKSKRIADGEFLGEVPQIGPLEFRWLAGQFNEMNARLDESFRQLRTSEASRRELVANVSHDLRTPMASIQSFVEALQDEIVKDEATFHQYLNTIRQETSRLSEMVDDLFQLSRLEAGAERFEPEPQHLDNVLLEILQSLTFQLEHKNLRVVTDIPENLPQLALMPLKIKRVLGNLLHNAIRHSPHAGMIRIEATPEFAPEAVLQADPEPAPQVTATEAALEAAAEAALEAGTANTAASIVSAASGSKSEWVRLSVTDEGEGIAEEEQAFVFERFYRTDKSRNRESGGSGLGLAIAKSIVELHGGEIGVTSTPGTGSTFWLTLPVYRV
jgi:two-component system sensor histidine kinase SaeS